MGRRYCYTGLAQFGWKSSLCCSGTQCIGLDSQQRRKTLYTKRTNFVYCKLDRQRSTDWNGQHNNGYHQWSRYDSPHWTRFVYMQQFVSLRYTRRINRRFSKCSFYCSFACMCRSTCKFQLHRWSERNGILDVWFRNAIQRQCIGFSIEYLEYTGNLSCYINRYTFFCRLHTRNVNAERSGYGTSNIEL